MKNMHQIILLLAGFMLTSSAGWAGANLVINGHFSDTNQYLRGWKYDYRDKYNLEDIAETNALMASNHLHVAVTNEGERPHVLALQGNKSLLWEIGQGVMVDGDPIPFAPGGRYTLMFSAWAKSTGPDCRILVEGYRWRPGIKPHANPKLSEVRKCYRFAQLYFGAEKTGTKGGILPAMGWSKSSVTRTFPDEKMSKLALESFNKIQFLVIHIAAFDGTFKDPEWVYLYVDDVVLERVNK